MLDMFFNVVSCLVVDDSHL